MENKNALILGCGASGVASAKFLAKRGFTITLLDTRENPQGLPNLKESIPEVQFFGGAMDVKHLEGKNLVVISPGLSPTTSPAAKIVAEAKEKGIDVIGEIELFARELAYLKETQNYVPKIVGITGTNGKTTTTTLVGLMAKQAGLSVAVAGNIGTNAVTELDCALEANQLPSVWVLELSSFQLETTSSLKCDAAAYLNLTQDHIDWHGSFESYAAAKNRIFSEGTIRVLNRDDACSMKAKKEDVTCYTFGSSAPSTAAEWGICAEHNLEWLSFFPPVKVGVKRHRSLLLSDEPDVVTPLIPTGALKIRGQHNVMNALAALALCKAIGVSIPASLKVLTTYCGESHRVQSVLSVNGIEFIDDSKGTNVGATIAALTGLGRHGEKSSIILGGDGKGQDFSPLKETLAKYASHITLIGRDADLIEKAIAGINVPTVNVGFKFDEAIDIAFKGAKQGEAVLLSPACASWDMFKNYAERAKRFKAKAVEIQKYAESH